MKKAKKKTKSNDRIRAEYDFTGGVRGKYAQRYAAGSNVVVLGPVVAQMCPTARCVNAALRAVGELASRRVRRTGAR